MSDSFKMFAIAAVTAIAVQLLLGPYILKLQGFVPTGTPTVPTPVVQPGPSAPAEAKLSAPYLEGMTVQQAQDRFRDKGITIVEDGEKDDPEAEPGSIIAQRPAPGAPLTSKEIHVTVAKGGETIPVPDVVGKPGEEARKALVDAGFEVPEPTAEPSDQPKGTVIKQVPNPGAQAKSGSQVRLVVAEAPAVEVPKAKGTSLRRARKAIEAAGLVVGSIRRVEDPERGEGIVLRQTPAPGEKVPPGSAVDLVVVAPN